MLLKFSFDHNALLELYTSEFKTSNSHTNSRTFYMIGGAGNGDIGFRHVLGIKKDGVIKSSFVKVKAALIGQPFFIFFLIT